MAASAVIERVVGRMILDSRGEPTVEVDVHLSDGSLARASVPSGASTGSREACELRDEDDARFGRRGVARAVASVNEVLAPALRDQDPFDQQAVDYTMRTIDGTSNKARLGANAILGVSLAVARAAALSSRVPLFRSLGDGNTLPVPMFNVLNGGAHADNNVDLQEFMIAPVGASSFGEAMRMGVETFHALRSLLQRLGRETAIGDEGGFAPNLRGDVEAIELILEAVMKAGLRPGVDIALAIDAAAGELCEEAGYVFRKSDGTRRSTDELITLYESWVRQFPIWSIEDGLGDSDWEGWRMLLAA
jgi:enolase